MNMYNNSLDLNVTLLNKSNEFLSALAGWCVTGQSALEMWFPSGAKA